MGDGKHIRPINTNNTQFIAAQREKEISADNLKLFDRIKNVMTRRTYDYRDNSYDRVFNRPSWPTTAALNEDITAANKALDVRKQLKQMKHNRR